MRAGVRMNSRVSDVRGETCDKVYNERNVR